VQVVGGSNPLAPTKILDEARFLNEGAGFGGSGMRTRRRASQET
jgi:hypothetical protein